MLTLLRGTFIRVFYLHYRADFFTGDVTNSGLHADFFYFCNLGHSRLVRGFFSLLKTLPLYLACSQTLIPAQFKTSNRANRPKFFPITPVTFRPKLRDFRRNFPNFGFRTA